MGRKVRINLEQGRYIIRDVNCWQKLLKSMSLCKLKISDVYHYFKKPRPSTRKWMKRQMNKYLRIQSKDVSEESLNPKKRNAGWAD